MSYNVLHPPEAIRHAAEGIRSCPWPVMEDILEDVLYLGAVGLQLEDRMALALRWVSANQRLILEIRCQGFIFADVVARVREVALGREWLDEFFRGVSPDLADPKLHFMSSLVELEDISMAGKLPVRFAIQAFIETPNDERHVLLENFAAETSTDTNRDQR